MKLLGMLICAVTRKHKRGKCVSDLNGVRAIQCPRCGGYKYTKGKSHAASV